MDGDLGLECYSPASCLTMVLLLGLAGEGFSKLDLEPGMIKTCTFDGSWERKGSFQFNDHIVYGEIQESTPIVLISC